MALMRYAHRIRAGFEVFSTLSPAENEPQDGFVYFDTLYDGLAIEADGLYQRAGRQRHPLRASPPPLPR